MTPPDGDARAIAKIAGTIDVASSWQPEGGSAEQQQQQQEEDAPLILHLRAPNAAAHSGGGGGGGESSSGSGSSSTAPPCVLVLTPTTAASGSTLEVVCGARMLEVSAQGPRDRAPQYLRTLRGSAPPAAAASNDGSAAGAAHAAAPGQWQFCVELPAGWRQARLTLRSLAEKAAVSVRLMLAPPSGAGATAAAAVASAAATPAAASDGLAAPLQPPSQPLSQLDELRLLVQRAVEGGESPARRQGLRACRSSYTRAPPRAALFSPPHVSFPCPLALSLPLSPPTNIRCGICSRCAAAATFALPAARQG